ncbi:MAG: hypothetical protein KDD40_04490 [Bdellovibrionales bacterium]|nr:hypothetical protein [Bdellovibrionales bacterium]
MSQAENYVPQKGAQILFRTGALGPGAKLWITPGGESSEWNRKLDWQLNFQISRAQDHQAKKLDQEFLKKLQEYEISLINNPANPSELLMISCENRLPTKMLVIIPFKEDVNSWLAEAHKVWSHLLKPSLRIFLPKDFPLNEFSRIWPDRSSVSDITLVPSQKSNQG